MKEFSDEEFQVLAAIRRRYVPTGIFKSPVLAKWPLKIATRVDIKY